MRILVDAHMIGHQETGNETYIRGLLTGLAQLDDLAVAAVYDPAITLPAALTGLNITWLPLAQRGSWPRLLWGLNRLSRQWAADCLHVSYNGPFRPVCPLVVSVHDVSFRRYPQFFSRRDRLLLSTLMPLTLRRAGAVLTLSEHARSEIQHFFPGLRAPIHAIPLAADPIFRPVAPAAAAAARERCGLPESFILAVGNLQPRKNLGRLVSAFAAVAAAFPAVHLAIVGQDWWRSSAVYQQVAALGLAERVHFTGYVSDDDLVGLYNAAQIFVYPSVYEGFGLPVLEAMACGRPVLTSQASSMPEVAGDAALLVDPRDVDALAGGLRRLLGDAAFRADLAARGRQRAAAFSWYNTAQETAKAYRQASRRANTAP